MDRVRGEKVALEARKTSLERAMTRAAEDAQHERDLLSRQAFVNNSNKPPKDTSAARAAEALASERKIRDLAELNVVGPPGSSAAEISTTDAICLP